MAIDRGKYIEDLIKESEFNKTQVAEMMGIGRSTLHRWTGESKPFHFLMCLKIN